MYRALTGALILGALLSLGLGIAYAILSPDPYSLVVLLLAVVVAGVWSIQALQSLAGQRADQRQQQKYLELAAAALPVWLQHLFGPKPIAGIIPAPARKQPVLFRRVRGGIPGPITTAPLCEAAQPGDQIWYAGEKDGGWQPLARYDGDQWVLVTGSPEAPEAPETDPPAEPPASDATAE